MEESLSIIFHSNNADSCFYFLKHINMKGFLSLYRTSKTIKKIMENSPTAKWYKESFQFLKKYSEEKQIKDLHLFIEDFYIRKEAKEKFDAGRNIFVTGAAGTGKTYEIIKWIESIDPTIILKTSTTAVSAMNFGGRTIDSTLLPIAINDSTFYKSGKFLTLKESVTNMCDTILKNLRFHETKINAILDAKIFIIDEVSMLSSFRMDYYSECLKKIRISDQPFGGLQVILCGDFFQFKPIATNIEINSEDVKIESTSQYAFESNAWKELNLFQVDLKYGHRQKDKEYLEILNRVRIGTPNQNDIDYLTKRIKKPKTTNVTSIFPTNKKVLEENERCLALLKTEKFEFSLRVFKNGNFDEKFIEKCIKESNLQRNLKLKIDCDIMITHNLKIDGLCNGVMGVFKGKSSTSEKEIMIELPNKTLKKIPLFSYKKLGTYGNYVSIEQFPVTLAYSISSHKSQGSTIEGDVYIDAGTTVFEDNQTYIMLSRSVLGERVYIRHFDSSKISVSQKVKEFYSIAEKKIDDDDISVDEFNTALYKWRKNVESIVSSKMNGSSIVNGSSLLLKKMKNEDN